MAPLKPVCTIEKTPGGEELVCKDIKAEGCVRPTRDAHGTMTSAEVKASRIAREEAVKVAGALYTEFQQVCTSRGPGFSVTRFQANPSFSNQPANATNHIDEKTGQYCVGGDYIVVFACEEKKQPPPTTEGKLPVEKAIPAEKPALETTPSIPPATPPAVEPKPTATTSAKNAPTEKACPADNSPGAVKCRDEEVRRNAGKAWDELDKEFE